MWYLWHIVVLWIIPFHHAEWETHVTQAAEPADHYLRQGGVTISVIGLKVGNKGYYATKYSSGYVN